MNLQQRSVGRHSLSGVAKTLRRAATILRCLPSILTRTACIRRSFPTPPPVF